MLEKGSGNRIAHRDYYEIERIEVAGTFSCASCESRLVDIRGSICRLCQQQIAQARFVRALFVWGFACLLAFMHPVQWLDLKGSNAFIASALLGSGAAAFVYWAAWRLEYWLQH